MKQSKLTDRLDRIKTLVAGDHPRSTQPDESNRKAAPARYQKLAQAMGGRVVVDLSGCYTLVETNYPFGHKFGSQELVATQRSERVADSSFSVSESSATSKLGDLLFIDTETTGLGGAGAVPFLIGCGSLTADSFQIRQYLLPDYSDEAAMLEQVLTEFGSQKTIVSYNGLAFDMNLIRDRMIVNRVARQIPQAGHFDLLHSARRLWRRRLRDCSLTNIERQLFDFYRAGDIPGALIPSVYLDWVHGDQLDQMAAVLEHNRLDILALYFLLLKVDEAFGTEGDSLDFVDDRYSLSRVYGRRRRHEKVVANFGTLQARATQPLADDLLSYHALAFKRTGDWSRAVEIWNQLCQSAGREALEANLELAKYYEHQTKDLRRAVDHARQAVRFRPVSRRLGDQLKHRLTRLERKLRD